VGETLRHWIAPDQAQLGDEEEEEEEEEERLHIGDLAPTTGT